MLPPEPCTKDRCHSPTACNGWGYCRERNFEDGGLKRLVPWDVIVERRRIAAERKAKEENT